MMACLFVCLSVCCGKQKGWIRSKKKKKPNQSRADHWHPFGRSLGKLSPIITESLAVVEPNFCFCFCSAHGTDTDSGRQPSRPRSCPGPSFLPNVVHAHHHDQSAPSMHTVSPTSGHSRSLSTPPRSSIRRQCLTRPGVRPASESVHRSAPDHTRHGMHAHPRAAGSV